MKNITTTNIKNYKATTLLSTVALLSMGAFGFVNPVLAATGSITVTGAGLTLVNDLNQNHLVDVGDTIQILVTVENTDGFESTVVTADLSKYGFQANQSIRSTQTLGQFQEQFIVQSVIPAEGETAANLNAGVDTITTGNDEESAVVTLTNNVEVPDLSIHQSTVPIVSAGVAVKRGGGGSLLKSNKSSKAKVKGASVSKKQAAKTIAKNKKAAQKIAKQAKKTSKNSKNKKSTKKNTSKQK